MSSPAVDPVEEQPAQAQSPESMVHVFDPDGNKAQVPQSRLQDALSQGFDHAVRVTDPEGQEAWMPSRKVHQALSEGFTVGQKAAVNASQPPKPSAISRAWDWANKGLISGDTLLRAGNQFLGTPDPETIKQAASRPPSPGESPLHAAARTGVAGALKDTAETASSFTSPTSIALAGTGVIGKAIPAASKAATAVRALQGTASAGFGAKGAEDIYEAATDKTKALPERVQEGLQGASMVAGGVAGAADAGPLARQAITKAGSTVIDVAKKPIEFAQSAVQKVKTAIDPVRNMPPQEAAIRAIKARNSKVDFPEELKTALPDARRSLDVLGIDPSNMTGEDALNAAVHARKAVWDEYAETHQIPVRNLTASTTPVARSIDVTITQRMREQQPGLVKRIEATADSYRNRNLSMQEIEDRLKEANNETRGLEARYVTDKRAAKADPQNRYLFAERDTLRQLLLDKMDQYTGPGAKELRQRYGNLVSFEDALSRRIPVMDRANPVSLTEVLGRIYGPARIAKGAIQILTGVGALHGAANIGEGIAIWKAANKAINDPEALLQHAFKQTTPTPSPNIPINGEYVPPSATTRTPGPPVIPQQPAGALPGPTVGQRALPQPRIFTPAAPPDTSGSVPYVPPPVDATTRAQRLGLVLPERGTTPRTIPLAGNSGVMMRPGGPLSLNEAYQYLRKAGGNKDLARQLARQDGRVF